MDIDQIRSIQENDIEILKIILLNVDDQLELSWEIFFESTFFRITFYNVSRIRVNNLSAPLQLHGFEIVNHSHNGWETDSKYEICDYEDECMSFFCEHFEIEPC